MPIVSVTSVDDTRDFYVEKLGFDHLMAVVGNDGLLEFCTVLMEGGRLMFNRASEETPGIPATQFYIQVSDVRTYRDRLTASGLDPTPLEDMWWGDRVTIVEDNNGIKLWFYQQVGDVVPPVGMKIV
ncbi:MAG: VOC family protein [Armatimonadetes bacterium]|nr:VOC family protein [Armatimonadota bacterium]